MTSLQAEPRAQQNLRLAERWFDEVWNQRRTETIAELLANSAIGRLEGAPNARPQDFVEHHRALLSALPDLRVRVEKAVADSRSVSVRWRLTGTHLGGGLGVPATGKSVDVFGLTWFSIEDGRIIEGWDSYNWGEALSRLVRIRAEEIQQQHRLTPRQADVALMMADRRSHKEIAKALDIRPNTARRHCQDVLRRLGIHRKQDVAEAIRAPEQ